MSKSTLPQNSRTSLQSSQLRYVSKRASSDEENRTQSNETAAGALHGKKGNTDGKTQHFSRVCLLGIHDEAFSTDDVLLNASLFPPDEIKPRTPMRILSLDLDSPSSSFGRYGRIDRSAASSRRLSAKLQSHRSSELSFVFRTTQLDPEIITKHPNLEVSVSRHLALALGLKNRSQVVLSKVRDDNFIASHIEITFRDAYLTRADMWRLFVTELADKSVYRGQKLLFIGTIRAQVKSIYMQGRKVQSAFCNASTKPVFRSESARYVLFIQMSKEMWDFDIDGTGEIMFHKVINGFLPELFKRWKEHRTRHLVSIILFTRMGYERGLASELEFPSLEDRNPNMQNTDDHMPHKDFYRVLVSDMASGQWADILTQLKREFKVFLRDVSICNIFNSQKLNSVPAMGAAGPLDLIAGRPMAATRGNILEAINLASSQFSGDYIDRDLVRTGLSIVVITPGTGVFEVDYKMLAMTTDSLIENGIGIDLVCLSRMPLHSVPLFKYRPSTDHEFKEMQEKKATSPQLSHFEGTFHSAARSFVVPEISLSEHYPQDDPNVNANDLDDWHYAVPHWIDVSYWSTIQNNSPAESRDVSQLGFASFRGKVFIPRVRMYEVQMMGIMENEMTSISLPYLPFELPSPTIYERLQESEASGQQFKQRKKRLHLEDAVSWSSNTNTAASPPSGGSFASVQTGTSKKSSALLACMDEYDEKLYSSQRHRSNWKRHGERVSVAMMKLEKAGPETHSLLGTSPERLAGSLKTERERQSGSGTKRPQLPQRKSSTKGSGSSNLPHHVKQNPLSRQISFGLRGFGASALKTTPITEISSENALSGSLLSRGLRSQQPTPKPPHLPFSNNVPTTVNKLEPLTSQIITLSAPDESSNLDLRSRPIAIKTGKDSADDTGKLVLLEDFACQKAPPIEEASVLEDNEGGPQPLPPQRVMAPWLTVLNPSNPHKMKSNLTGRLGKWHHLFPRPISASNIKWKSLCSPASVPLTTEEFPTESQLSIEYTESVYTVSAKKANALSEDVDPNSWLARELISARLSHGFQFVVGSNLPSPDDTGIFSNAELSHVGMIVFLSKGSTIHRLSVINEGVVEIKRYQRRGMMRSISTEQSCQAIKYWPAVRTTLGERYISRELLISSPQQTYDWQRLDSFVADHEEQQLESYPDSLQFWRARFVLIPKERSSSNKRVLQVPSEDNAEEIRLEGIRKLTQLWQRNRYVQPDERRFHNALRKRKDTNPLDIIYQTRNPSAIVAAELNDAPLLAVDGNDTKITQQIPDSELFERVNLNVSSLANAIQGERGIRLLDRRWHLRLHYNCFIGMELTTWLINNFKDVDSREEAVELGNELMKQGLFQHVERRHNFRDGNFFYQIQTSYRVARESRGGWFGSRRSDRSVPSTPVTEVTKSISSEIRSRSRSNGEDASDSESTTPTRRQTLGFALSRRLAYDVDPRKRSYRQELINLHYDRISSADDCYHLRIDWMMVTPKLIEDAIVQWATSAERNGLRLVELPIGEASRINEFHPFRAPYLVHLAKSPPERLPLTYLDATSLTPRPSSFPYHKAILKNFDFVLDLEAAKDFPASVDVTYSWGKPDYRYPQYISREGVLLVQITDDGDFLLLANRLYNNRSAVDPEGPKPLLKGTDERYESGAYRSPAGGPLSPTASPAIRATPDVGPGFASSKLVTPEKLAKELETFCQDVKALEAFYDAELQKSVASGPATPFLESTVSSIGLPPALNLRDGSPALHLDAVGEKNGAHLGRDG